MKTSAWSQAMTYLHIFALKMVCRIGPLRDNSQRNDGGSLMKKLCFFTALGFLTSTLLIGMSPQQHHSP